MPVPRHRARALKWTLFRHASALTKNFHKQLGKRIKYREIGDKFEVSASTAGEKVNTVGTGVNLFRLVPVIGHSARVLPQKLMPVPRHGAQISGYVQTGARARAEQGLSLF